MKTNDEKGSSVIKKILINEELFKKMISFINRNHYELLRTRIHPKDENFSYAKKIILHDGEEFIEVVYVFMDPNKCSNFEPWIKVGSNKNYGNEIIDMKGLDRIKNVVNYAITKDGIVEWNDYSINCKNVVCSYDEFLEMVNK